MQTEVSVFTHYLIRRSPAAKQVSLYRTAVARIESTASLGTYALSIRKPRYIPYLDAYDALFDKNSQLRQRLYLLFSILEASPDNTAAFLPSRHSFLYIFTVIGLGARAVFRLMVGFIIVKAGKIQ